MTKDSSKDNKIFNRNNLANWIIGGFIALIIGKIMEPLFTHIFSFILNIGGSLITYISNSTYKEISNGYSEQTASSTLYLIYIFAFVTLENVFLDNIARYKTYKKELVQIVSPTPPMSQEKLVTSSHDLESINKRIKKLLIKTRLLYLFIMFSFLFLLISLIFFYGRSSFIRNKTIVMTNNIEIVSPYISDLEYKQLKSKFHSMETQTDYNSLMEELEAIADEYSLKLK